jgi:hypothetical protein
MNFVERGIFYMIRIEKEIEFFGSWSSILRILRKLSLRYRMCNIGTTLFIERRY